MLSWRKDVGYRRSLTDFTAGGLRGRKEPRVDLVHAGWGRAVGRLCMIGGI